MGDSQQHHPQATSEAQARNNKRKRNNKNKHEESYLLASTQNVWRPEPQPGSPSHLAPSSIYRPQPSSTTQPQTRTKKKKLKPELVRLFLDKAVENDTIAQNSCTSQSTNYLCEQQGGAWKHAKRNKWDCDQKAQVLQHLFEENPCYQQAAKREIDNLFRNAEILYPGWDQMDEEQKKTELIKAFQAELEQSHEKHGHLRLKFPTLYILPIAVVNANKEMIGLSPFALIKYFGAMPKKYAKSENEAPSLVCICGKPACKFPLTKEEKEFLNTSGLKTSPESAFKCDEILEFDPAKCLESIIVEGRFVSEVAHGYPDSIVVGLKQAPIDWNLVVSDETSKIESRIRHLLHFATHTHHEVVDPYPQINHLFKMMEINAKKSNTTKPLEQIVQEFLGHYSLAQSMDRKRYEFLRRVFMPSAWVPVPTSVGFWNSGLQQLSSQYGIFMTSNAARTHILKMQMDLIEKLQHGQSGTTPINSTTPTTWSSTTPTASSSTTPTPWSSTTPTPWGSTTPTLWSSATLTTSSSTTPAFWTTVRVKHDFPSNTQMRQTQIQEVEFAVDGIHTDVQDGCKIITLLVPKVNMQSEEDMQKKLQQQFPKSTITFSAGELPATRNIFGEYVYEVCVWDDNEENWRLHASSESNILRVRHELSKQLPPGKHLTVLSVPRRIRRQEKIAVKWQGKSWDRCTTGEEPIIIGCTLGEASNQIRRSPQLRAIIARSKEFHDALLAESTFDLYSAEQTLLLECLLLQQKAPTPDDGETVVSASDASDILNTSDNSSDSDLEAEQIKYDVYLPPIFVLKREVVGQLAKNLKDSTQVDNLMLPLLGHGFETIRYFGCVVGEVNAGKFDQVYDGWLARLADESLPDRTCEHSTIDTQQSHSTNGELAQDGSCTNMEIRVGGSKLGDVVYCKHQTLTATFTRLELKPGEVIILRAHVQSTNEVLVDALTTAQSRRPQTEIELAPFQFCKSSRAQAVVIVAASRSVDGSQRVLATSEPFRVREHRSFFNRKESLTPNSPLSSLPGVGPTFSERLSEHGIITVQDLADCDYNTVRELHQKITRPRSKLTFSTFIDNWQICNHVCSEKPQPLTKLDNDRLYNFAWLQDIFSSSPPEANPPKSQDDQEKQSS